MTNTLTREPVKVPAPSPKTLSHRQILSVLSGLLLGMFLAALDQNIVSVAIVRIANSLHGFDKQAWVTTAYLITATISTPLYGKLADIYGRKPCYLISIGIFVIGSAACTFATSMYQLAGFRAFQGLGAGGLMSLAFTIIGDLVPVRERVRYQGYFMMVWGVSTVLGPVLGGFFSDYQHLGGLAGWRWVFLVNVPIGLFALFVVSRSLNLAHVPRKQRVDWPGAIALAFTVVPLLIVAEQGRTWGWTSRRAVLCYCIGSASLMILLIIEQLMEDSALIPLRLFADPTFAVTIAGGFVVGVAMFGAISMVPLYLQVVRGYSPTKSGLMMLPLVLGIMVGSQLAGQITKVTGRYKFLPVAGTAVIALGALLYAHVHYDSAVWQPLCYSAIIGFGLGGCMQTLIIAAQNAGPRADLGVSTATATFFRQMGGTLGVAVFLTILFNLLPRKILHAFGGALPPGFDADRLNGLQSNTSGIAALPPELRRPILIGFTDALHAVFYAGAAAAVLACVVLVFMREIPLRDAAAPAAEPAPEPAEPVDLEPVESGEYVYEIVAGGDSPNRDLPDDGPAEPDEQTEPDVPLTAVAESTVVPEADTEPEPDPEESDMADPDDTDVAYLNLAQVPDYPTDEHAVLSFGPHSSQTGETVDPLTVTAALTGGATDFIYDPLGQPPAEGPWFAGRVQREDGNPVPGAALTLIDPRGHQVSRDTARADGEFTLAAPEPGSYVLIAAAAGHQPTAVNVVIGERPHAIDVTLAGAGELSGVVRGGGEPIAGATVTLADLHGEVVGAAVTGPDGYYTCRGIISGTYTLVAVADHMRPAAGTLVVPETGLLRHDLELAPMAVLEGAAWADGRAVADAQVTVLDATGELIARTHTDELGHYLVPDLPEGVYTVVARGYPVVTSRVAIAGAETTHDLVLGYEALD
ncbi:MFS transporter [Nocardia stercoris]|nr:MFS transporter [Nocardia stercoris]